MPDRLNQLEFLLELPAPTPFRLADFENGSGAALSTKKPPYALVIVRADRAPISCKHSVSRSKTSSEISTKHRRLSNGSGTRTTSPCSTKSAMCRSAVVVGTFDDMVKEDTVTWLRAALVM